MHHFTLPPLDTRARIQGGPRFRNEGERYEILKLPAGPRNLPDWLIDMVPDFNDGYGNLPEFKALFKRNPLEGVRFRKESNSNAWIGTSPDGFCTEVHWHSGAVARLPYTRRVNYGPGGWVDLTVDWLQTTQQNGYGGRHFIVHMADDSPLYAGEHVVLRGPWHAGAAGNIHVSGLIWDDKQRAQSRRYRPNAKGWRAIRQPWWRRTLCFGYALPEQLIIDAYSTFQPHLELARVLRYPGKDYGGWRLEPVDPRTGVPKGFELW